MPDHGHDLRFGVFVTPSAQQAESVLALAGLAESSGLDLVTFQDHPYQRDFLETWTLLSAVAARTGRITVAPNVLNVPLRLPPMIGKSAATLDLLSGGRLLLGLGAGAFWDGIVRMGGARLSGGEAVAALDDAVTQVRRFFRGPIAIGSYQPRMLRLTGRVADAWLPSLGYLEPEDFAERSAVIDDAARAAGRRPADVRRILNLMPDALPENRADWVRVLAGWAVGHGFDTFVLAADDPGLLRQWAGDLAPAVRERVADLRAGSGSAPVPTVGPEEGADATTPTAGPDDVVAQYTRLGVQPTPATAVGAEWDEPARPHRAPSGADVMYSPAGAAVGAHLIEVHDLLRSELAQLRDVVEQVRAGSLAAADARAELNEMTLRQNTWTMGAFCQRYCAFVAGHHGLEDASIFPHLRAAERDLGPVLDRLHEEHEVIHDAIDGVDRALVTHLREPADFTALDAAVDRLATLLVSHLSYEETELVEPLARLGFYPGQV